MDVAPSLVPENVSVSPVSWPTTVTASPRSFAPPSPAGVVKTAMASAGESTVSPPLTPKTRR